MCDKYQISDEDIKRQDIITRLKIFLVWSRVIKKKEKYIIIH